MYNLSLINTIKKYMLQQNQTLAVAESVTSGHLQAALSLAENADSFFQGGITAYNMGQQCKHLNVDPIEAAHCNCISEKVAGSMAEHVCNMFSSDWGVAATGYAAPVPQNKEKFLYSIYSVAFQGHVVATNKIKTGLNDPLKAQFYYTNEILLQLSELLKKR